MSICTLDCKSAHKVHTEGSCRLCILLILGVWMKYIFRHQISFYFSGCLWKKLYTLYHEVKQSWYF